MSYTAFVIDEQTRESLLTRYKPKFPDVYAHHITLKMGHHSDLLELTPPMIVICGRIVTDSIDVLLVTVGGRSTRKFDNKKYHITWSLDRSKGVKPVDSNKAIEQYWDSRDILVPCIVSGQIQLCD